MNPAPVEQHPPRVTALIVSRNCAEQLKRCLQALERSVERDRLEILVVDNGSQDASAEVALEFPDVQSLRLPKEFGKTKAANIGMRTAKGDLILFVPPHVEVQPDTVVQLAERLEKGESVGAVLPFIDRWFRLPNQAALATACETGALPDPQLVPADVTEVAVDYAPGAPIMVRRLFLRGMNYFDEKYGEYWSDLELCWQLRNAGKSILVLPQIRVQYGSPESPQRDPLHSADCTLGAAAYLAKHVGSGAGLKFRISGVMSALFHGQFARMSALVSGQKVDGTHI